MYDICCENLANAIVLCAVNDYRTVLRCLKNNPYHYTAGRTKEKLEQFFRSDWYTALTRVDGEMLITRLREETEHDK